MHGGRPFIFLLFVLIFSAARSFAPAKVFALRAGRKSSRLCQVHKPSATNSTVEVRRAPREVSVLGTEAPQGALERKATIAALFQGRWEAALRKIRDEPVQTLTIPLSAAFVGWITNKLAVEMLFYPLRWRGLPLWVVEGQPLGLIGWQGIVPAKAASMASRMVDMVTDQLVDVDAVFARLNPHRVARLLSPEVTKMTQRVATDLLPSGLDWLPAAAGAGLSGEGMDALKSLRHRMLVDLVRDMQRNLQKVVDLKELVVGEMLADRRVIVELFQRCGRAEFKFLVDSGFYFGFLLGIIQMFVWLLICDKAWTLPVGGAIVGYITNWLALEIIFKPVEPIKFGGFVFHGLFLQRQAEVAAEFAAFFSSKILTSRNIWRVILFGSRAPAFNAMLGKHVRPFLRQASALAGVPLDETAAAGLTARMAAKLPDHVHVLHGYTDEALGLGSTMDTQMRKMSSKNFEEVLHPIFQEDELTLILAGGVLGALAGGLQMLLSSLPPGTVARTARAAANGVRTRANVLSVWCGGQLRRQAADQGDSEGRT